MHTTAPLAWFSPLSGGQLRLGPFMVVSYGQGDRGQAVGVRFHKTPRAFAASLGSRRLLGSRSRHHGFLRKLRLPTVAPLLCQILLVQGRVSLSPPRTPSRDRRRENTRRRPGHMGLPGTAKQKEGNGDKPCPTPSAYSNVPRVCWRVPPPPWGARANTQQGACRTAPPALVTRAERRCACPCLAVARLVHLEPGVCLVFQLAVALAHVTMGGSSDRCPPVAHGLALRPDSSSNQ